MVPDGAMQCMRRQYRKLVRRLRDCRHALLHVRLGVQARITAVLGVRIREAVQDVRMICTSSETTQPGGLYERATIVVSAHVSMLHVSCLDMGGSVLAIIEGRVLIK